MDPSGVLRDALILEAARHPDGPLGSTIVALAETSSDVGHEVREDGIEAHRDSAVIAALILGFLVGAIAVYGLGRGLGAF